MYIPRGGYSTAAAFRLSGIADGSMAWEKATPGVTIRGSVPRVWWAGSTLIVPLELSTSSSAIPGSSHVRIVKGCQLFRIVELQQRS